MQDTSFTLLTDLYQITMAYGYWKTGIAERPAVFHLFYRKNPFGNPYAIACGLERAISWLNTLRFSAGDVQYLGSLKGADGKALFDESFLNYLQRLRFSCDLDAIPEGTVVLPNEPLIRIQGPLLQAQFIETALLNLINFSTLIATKSARVVQAAFGMLPAQCLQLGDERLLDVCKLPAHGSALRLVGGLLGLPLAPLKGRDAAPVSILQVQLFHPGSDFTLQPVPVGLAETPETGLLALDQEVQPDGLVFVVADVGVR